jgi:type IV pilus assembly protein PilY1
MNPTVKTRLLSVFAGLLLSLAGASAARADDTEVFTGASTTGVAPNILLILDTSGSMSSQVTTQTPYDPTVTYAGTCDPTVTYFQASGGSSTPTGCVGLSTIASTYQKCQAAASSLASGANAVGPGFYTDQFVQWRSASGKYSWTSTVKTTSTTKFDVACEGDYPGTPSFPTTYNGNSNTTANEWTSNASGSTSYWKNNGAGGAYTLYSANYLNYQAANPAVVIGTRIQVVQQAATNLINSLSNVNIGLMRYSNNGGSGDAAAAGGMVAYPVSPVAANRTGLTTALNSYSAGGYTPLSETLYEAYLYYSGGNVYFGNNSVPFHSVAASRVGGVATSNQYQTPIQYQCQKNFIVYLTDGLPTEDNQADSLITGLPNESTIGGACDNTNASPYNGLDASGNAIPGGWGPSATAGKCMSALSKYMFNADLLSSMQGQQNVSLYTIGFGDDPALAAASVWLQKAATAGGGQFYAASDLNGLNAVLTNIVSNILKTATTFTAPTVSVNAFNRTQTLNDLYVSVFQPSGSFHWPGNVKKYSVYNGVIVDQNNVPAVDPTTGFFKDSAQSIWSAAPDGAKVTAGGAANQLPDWNPADTPTRNVYTYIGTNTPASSVALASNASYSLVATNALLTNTLLGVTTVTQHDNAIAYARGEDLKDENGNTIINEQRHDMGDPLHSQPAVVIYGGTTASPNVNDAVIYAATNDGLLHAFDVNDGHELWAFMPQEFLPQLLSLYQDLSTSPKHYALDGNVKVLKYDINGDGIIDPAAGDRVLMFFGTGRGGSRYYAMDVTSKTNPKFLWSIGPETPGMSAIGQTWSSPIITRVNVGGGATQNSQKFVLLFGGGYDPAEETVNTVSGAMSSVYQTADGVGTGLYMVDALYGSVLWSAGPSTSSANLKLARMDHSIPSDLTVMDLDGDGYADRIYVGDMAAQLWRFDIYNGNSASGLVTGGVIASLGTHDDTLHSSAATRRFYSAPDVSAIRKKGISPFFNIAIGSGYRGHPLDISVQDRFYSIRDYNAFTKLTQTAYNTPVTPIIHDSDATLIDITTGTPVVPSGAEGWKLTLNQPSGWVGEKVLATSTTFNGQILFTTYTPGAAQSANPCTPGVGTNRLYDVGVFDGSAQIPNRYVDLNQGGIAPPVSFLFPAPDDDEVGLAYGAGGAGGGTGTGQTPVVCMSGAEVLGVCKSFNSRVKTFWSDSDAK